MRDWRGQLSRNGGKLFIGFLVFMFLFMVAAANGKEIEAPQGWKEDIKYHCVPTRFESNEKAMNFLFSRPKFKKMVSEGNAKIINQTDNRLDIAIAIKDDGKLNDTIHYTYSPFKVCIQGFVKDGKKAEL